MGDVYSCDTVVANGTYIYIVVTLLLQMGDVYICDTVVANGTYIYIYIYIYI